jgi:hypothetical protein
MEILEEQQIYAVYTNTDLTEGRGQEYCMALAENESTAIRLAAGKGVQGMNARVMKANRILVKAGEYRKTWYAPSLLVHKPNREDLENERIINAERAKNLLLEKFKSGEELSKTERELIIEWLKK